MHGMRPFLIFHKINKRLLDFGMWLWLVPMYPHNYDNKQSFTYMKLEKKIARKKSFEIHALRLRKIPSKNYLRFTSQPNLYISIHRDKNSIAIGPRKKKSRKISSLHAFLLAPSLWVPQASDLAKLSIVLLIKQHYSVWGIFDPFNLYG